ncbi:DUF1552 domain-containing protein [Planctomicrobium sp. SH664]|uniref:DUF1552 domain-containing protein n=1 Tax=Planctomicrobium sp. SH664 TaxID=3448125 RepID=UPI003F5B17A8
MVKSVRISRRTLLRGVGAAVALPWLEAMSAPLAWGKEMAGPPVRMGFFYVPNGVNMADWKPKETGALSELPRTLQPLEPVKDRVLVLSDLAAEHCESKAAGHEPAGGGYLVGQKCKHSEVPEVGGISVDQLAARELGLKTPVDSLALGIDVGYRGDHGYSGTYMTHISWRSKTTPAALELNPKQLYDRLFRGRPLKQPNWDAPEQSAAAPTNPVEASVLDLVQEDARALQRKLGYDDRRKMEEYLDGVRSIERRVAFASRDQHSHHQDSFADDPLATADDPTLPRLVLPDGHGIPSLYSEHVNLMLDILTLAFQTDTTRVASFMFSIEKSGRSYPEIGVRAGHHSTSHHGSKADKLELLSKINTHHMELFSRMLQRMAGIREGEGTLLDNVIFCYGSGISDGNRHNHDNLPVIVAGGAGGAVQGGRHLAYDKKTPICNLYLEMLQKVGVPQTSFGDSTGLLGNLGS